MGYKTEWVTLIRVSMTELLYPSPSPPFDGESVVVERYPDRDTIRGRHVFKSI